MRLRRITGSPPQALLLLFNMRVELGSFSFYFFIPASAMSAFEMQKYLLNSPKDNTLPENWQELSFLLNNPALPQIKCNRRQYEK